MLADPAVMFDVVSLHPDELEAAVPLWETAVPAGSIGVAVIDGSAEDWDLQTAAEVELAAAPVITVAVVRDGYSAAARACDFVVEDDEHLDALLERISRAPGPTLVAAQLLRNASLISESFAYSTLLGGESFRDWRAANEPRDAADDSERVAVETHNGVTVIRLTRATRHNAYDSLMREQLCDALDAVTAAGRTPVVLLGDGPSFCSGGDLDEFGTSRDPVASHVVRMGRSVARRLQRIRGRLVVGMHGHCIGAGVELAAYARIVVAAEGATFRLPELSLGLNLGAGGAASIPRRIGRHRTLRLLVDAEPIDAQTALEWRLVDEIVPYESLEQRCLARAGALA